MGGTVASHKTLEAYYHKQSIKLGEGAFGTVWRGVKKGDEEYVAIKELDLRLPGAGRNRAAYEKEAMLLSKVKHEHIVNLHGVFENHGCFQLVMDYCDVGDLQDQISQMGKALKVRQAKDYLHQILSAISALHAVHVIHRDVKPANILIASGEGRRQILKLTDFGIADFLPDGHLLHEKVGTPAFMAPEQHKLPDGSGYDLAADIWAAGIIAFMLMHKGAHPFMENGFLNLKRLHGDKPPSKSTHCLMFTSRDAEHGTDLCNALLSANPRNRFNAAEALHHLFFMDGKGPRAGCKHVIEKHVLGRDKRAHASIC